MILRAWFLALFLALVSQPAAAQSARDILTEAAFASPDKPAALAKIGQAIRAADAALARNPGDQDMRLQRTLAMSYRGKLTRSRSDVAAARRGFEAAVAANPRNAEAQMALAGWHLGSVIELGPLVARTMLGARTAAGLQALDRSVALGGDRAIFPSVACLHRIQIDTKDVAGSKRLCEAAIGGQVPTTIDRIMQRAAGVVLDSLRKGDGASAARSAKMLLPFGRLR